MAATHTRTARPFVAYRSTLGDGLTFGAKIPDALSRQAFFAAFLTGDRSRDREPGAGRMPTTWKQPAFDFDELLRHYERTYFRARYRLHR